MRLYMNRLDRISLFEDLKKIIGTYNSEIIECGVVCYYLDMMSISNEEFCIQAKEVSKTLKDKEVPIDLETMIEFFEFMLDDDTKNENGIVFTPKFISDYIVNSIFEKTEWFNEKKIIDPGCGCGIFLISAAEIIHKKYKTPIDQIIENNIYGIDINEDNVRRCKLALRLLSAKYGGDYKTVKCNVHCCDSLKINWAEEFGVAGFDYVIGNPPYVNPHDMQSDTIRFLKKNFKTTQKGVFNIFYAFIEHAISNLKEEGVIGYIVPNNFLTIKAALDLRNYLQTNKYLLRILDFGHNMVFKPVRTYNCIVLLSKSKHDIFDYFVMGKNADVEKEINNIVFNRMAVEKLDSNGWKLVDERTMKNLKKIENNMISIKSFIRTGIATLKDAIFMVEYDSNGYFKRMENSKYYIEKDLVKPIYRIPDLKSCKSIEDAERYIIFPYIKSAKGYVLIPEEVLKKDYPLTYNVLLANKEVLDLRDKGRPNPQGWYAYGRSQGLNKYGKKLLFPTFSNYPRFMLVNNEEALFCNGYGIFENEFIDLEILMKILNSSVMDYYIKNTSYSIEGGYYCYQKKYIERFSIPWLSDRQRTYIRHLCGNELDKYLWDLYELD